MIYFSSQNSQSISEITAIVEAGLIKSGRHVVKYRQKGARAQHIYCIVDEEKDKWI